MARNVRELEVVLEQAMIFKDGDWIMPEDLDLPVPRDASVAGSQAGTERSGANDLSMALSWLQHEALRVVAERGEVRRREFVARGRISR